MKATPLKRFGTPAYPTRLEVLADPKVLEEHVPPRWHLAPELAGTVTIFLAANGLVNAAETAPQLKQDAAAVVAPIFAHGEGRGAMGCVVVSPPLFLSEEEALQVITEELTRAGLVASRQDVDMKDVSIQQREEYYINSGNTYKRMVRDIPGKTEPLNIDLLDVQHQVGIEYVSSEDYYTLGGPKQASTVSSYAFKEVAEGVAKTVRDKGKGVYFGTFYDPVAKPKMSVSKDGEDPATHWEALRDRSLEESKSQLRQQVKDFVDWLKGQGAILPCTSRST